MAAAVQPILRGKLDIAENSCIRNDAAAASLNKKYQEVSAPELSLGKWKMATYHGRK